jgi:hypothetical protein
VSISNDTLDIVRWVLGIWLGLGSLFGFILAGGSFFYIGSVERGEIKVQDPDLLEFLTLVKSFGFRGLFTRIVVLWPHFAVVTPLKILRNLLKGKTDSDSEK